MAQSQADAELDHTRSLNLPFYLTIVMTVCGPLFFKMILVSATEQQPVHDWIDRYDG